MSRKEVLASDIRFKPIASAHSKSNTAIGWSDPYLRVQFDGENAIVRRPQTDQPLATVQPTDAVSSNYVFRIKFQASPNNHRSLVERDMKESWIVQKICKKSKDTVFNTLMKEQIGCEEVYFEEDFQVANDRSILDWIRNYRPLAYQLQELIPNCSQMLIDRITNVILPCMPEMMVHPIGCHLLCRLLHRSTAIQTKILQLSMSGSEHSLTGTSESGHILALANNEYSSKVLQELVLLNVVFKRTALQMLMVDPLSLLQTSSAAFLCVSVVRASTDSEKFHIARLICLEPRRWTHLRLCKRVLQILVESSNQEILDYLWSHLGQSVMQKLALTDKSVFLLILAFIVKGCNTTISDLIQLTEQNPKKLLRSPVFKQLCQTSLRNSPLQQLQRILISKLTRLSTSSLKVVFQSGSNYANYSRALFDLHTAVHSEQSLTQRFPPYL